MPLCQKHRSHINSSIEHIFFDIPKTQLKLIETAKEINKALEKSFTPLAEEKEAEEKSSGSPLVFHDLFRLFSEPEKLLRNSSNLQLEPLSAEETITYIFFYTICCLQFHLENPNKEDFNLEEWLHTKNFSAAELAENWQPLQWFERLNSQVVLQNLNLNLQELLDKFNQFKTKNKSLIFSSNPVSESSFGYDWELPRLKNQIYTPGIKERWIIVNNPSGQPYYYALLDLHVEIQTPDGQLINITKPNFAWYPNAFPNIINPTPAQQQIIAMANNLLHKKIKIIAAIHGKIIATNTIVNVLKNAEAEAAEVQEVESHSSSQENVLEEIEEGESSNSDPAEELIADYISSDSDDDLSSPLHILFDEDPLLEHLDPSAPGASLLTRPYFFNKVISKSMKLWDFAEFTETEADNLNSDTLYPFLEKELISIKTGATLSEEVLRLLEHHFYNNYFLNNPSELKYILNLSKDKAIFLRLPIITNLFAAKILNLQTALSFTHEAQSVFFVLIFATYLKEHPEEIPLLNEITPLGLTHLLKEEVKELISRGHLKLTYAMRLTPLQIELITNKHFKNLFLCNKDFCLFLPSLSDEKIKKLLNQKMQTLFESKIVKPEEAIVFSEEQLDFHCHDATYQLLISGILNSKRVCQFTPLIEAVISHPIYSSILKNHSNPNHHPVFWLNETQLQLLLKPQIILLFYSKKLHMVDMTSFDLNFFIFICENSIYELLSKDKIDIQQIRRLTPTTIDQIQTNFSMQTVLKNSANNHDLNYIQLTVWSEHLSDKLMYLYVYCTHKPEIKSQILGFETRLKLIAEREKLEVENLISQTLQVFLKKLSKRFSDHCNQMSSSEVPSIYNELLEATANIKDLHESQLTNIFLKIFSIAESHLDHQPSAFLANRSSMPCAASSSSIFTPVQTNHGPSTTSLCRRLLLLKDTLLPLLQKQAVSALNP